MSRILVADDDAEILLSVEAALNDEGHQILLAHNGAVALDLLESRDIDLVVLDIYMPEKDGIEVLRLGQAMDGFEMPPVIAISGGGIDGTASLALTTARAFGVVAILYKPFSSEDLISTVRTSLR